MKTFLLDPGHGGMIGATYYETRGKRSPEVRPGLGVYEGEFNRDIISRVLARGLFQGLRVMPLFGGAQNMPLRERVHRAGVIQQRHGPCVLLSVHANAAFGPAAEWKGARGWRVFYSWRTESRRIAHVLHDHLRVTIGGMTRERQPRRASFRIFRAAMPAVLLEAAFMDNHEDAALLADNSFRDAVATAIVRSISERGGGKQ